MAAFVALGSWTELGIEAAKNVPERTKAAKDLAASMGGRIIGIWWTVGAYDFVSISEFPDDETYSRFALAAAHSGAYRTVSMRAFSEDEMGKIIQMLG